MECVYYNESHSGDDELDQTSFYDKIYNDYHGIHGYVATILCVFGLLANWCNILVLTRSEMFSTINMLLTAIAVCDSTLMISYTIYLAHFQLAAFKCSGLKYTFGWAVFTVIHADLSVALRACSLWLSVVMAALRSHILSRHQVLLLQSRYIANKKLGYKLIFTTVTAVLLMTIPVFINHTIEPMPIRQQKINNRSVFGDHAIQPCPRLAWIVVPPTVTLEYDCLILKIGYWTNGLLLKLVPCILLTYYLIKLIHFIKMHMQNSQAKFGERETVNSLKPTTFLLSAILLVTLLCELPNALASLFSGVRSFAFGVMIYKSLGDIFDLLALVNGITSFILYCSMSQMFRETFINITCDVRDYFLSRSTAYYRRWSVNVFGPSQSTVEFQQQQQQQNPFEHRDDRENGQISHVQQFENPDNQFLFTGEFRHEFPQRDKYRPWDNNFETTNSVNDSYGHKRFGPSPSSSSEKLLNDDHYSMDEKGQKKKNKNSRKQQLKNSSLPMFDYSNSSFMHSHKTMPGTSMTSPERNTDQSGDSEERKTIAGSYPGFEKR